MILSFKCPHPEALFQGRHVKRFANVEVVAMRRLQQIPAAATLDLLRAPPGNRLEALSGDRAGQYSIRINAQWRVCFRFSAGISSDVEIVAYH